MLLQSPDGVSRVASSTGWYATPGVQNTTECHFANGAFSASSGERTFVESRASCVLLRRLIAAGQAFANQNRDTPTSSEDSVGHPSATQATVLTNKEHGCSCERDIEKSKAAAGGALGTPQGSAESSDMVHVPKLALWLVGAAVTLMLAVIITLLYVVSTTRHRLASGPAVEPNKLPNHRSRSASQSTVEIIGKGESINVESVVSSPRTRSTAVRTRSASQEGVICLD